MLSTYLVRARLVLVALVFTLATVADAAQIDGHTYDERIRVENTELVLNGVGMRAVLWLKGYTAGLYMVEKASTSEQILQQRGPKRIQMRLLLAVQAKEFIKAFNKGVRRNVNATELPALLERMEQFNRILTKIGSFKVGDVVNLDFIPKLGLVLTMNGDVRGDPIPGDDMYRALLKVFVGERPVDKRLKAGLLGAPATS